MKLFFALAFVFSLSSQALALGGTSVKDGGQGVACGSHVELLDLYEARHLKGHETLTSGKSSLNLEQQILAWWDILESFKVTPAHDYGIGDAFVMGLSPMSPDATEPNSFLRWVDDFSPSQYEFDYGQFVVAPGAGCRLIQLGIWDPQFSPPEVMTLSSVRWQGLDTIDQAALVLHETLHSFFDRDDTNLANRELLILLTGTPEYQKSHVDVLADLLRTRRSVGISRLQ